MTSQRELDSLAVENFRTYLRFQTVHPDPDYTEAVNWLRNQGTEIGLECFLVELIPKNPILVMKWQGNDPSLRAIMLNSHMDVVAVEREKWTHDPFAAEMTPDGNIYARGTQDMKSVGVQHLEAVRRLKLGGFIPKRTIYLTYLPDEEVGGGCGMQPFVEGREPVNPNLPNEIRFEDMNVGLCLDEGIASPRSNIFYAFYEERSPWWVKFVISGNAGHGSRFIENTAVEKLHRLMDKLLAFRDAEKRKLETMVGNDLALGSVISTNITVIHGGVETNIVPGQIEVQVDFRLPPTIDFNKFEDQLNTWARESGDGIEIIYIQKDMSTTGEGKMTDIHNLNDPVLNALQKAIIEQKVEFGLFFGSTDSRFIRRWHKSTGGKPIKAVGFSPICNTPVLLHDHDEFLNKKIFLDGVTIFKRFVAEIANFREL
nr:aminoacylase 1 [Hymenolepis microstoma]